MQLRKAQQPRTGSAGRQSKSRGLATILVAAGILASMVPGSAFASTNLLMAENFQRLPAGGDWKDGSVHGELKTVFDGYGSVGVVKTDSKVLSLQPRKSTSNDETHAALVTTKQSYGDVSFSVRAKTVKQLRASSPNTWETAWAMWHYTDNTHFYYVVLKPNGWELGKGDPKYAGAQRFLATGSSPKFPIGSWNETEVTQTGAAIDVSVDGQHLTHFVDEERPYLKGAIGMYCEDSRVYFDDLSVAKA